jgi:hypothetical protein
MRSRKTGQADPAFEPYGIADPGGSAPAAGVPRRWWIERARLGYLTIHHLPGRPWAAPDAAPSIPQYPASPRSNER